MAWNNKLLVFPMCADVQLFDLEGNFERNLEAQFGTFPGWFVWPSKNYIYFRTNMDHIGKIDNMFQTQVLDDIGEIADFCVQYSTDVVTWIKTDSREISNQYAKKILPNGADGKIIRQLNSDFVVVTSNVTCDEGDPIFKVLLFPIKTLEVESSLSIEGIDRRIRHIRLLQTVNSLELMLADCHKDIILLARVRNTLVFLWKYPLSISCMLVSHLHDDTWVVCGEHTAMLSFRLIIPPTLQRIS